MKKRIFTFEEAVDFLWEKCYYYFEALNLNYSDVTTDWIDEYFNEYKSKDYFNSNYELKKEYK